MDGFAKDYEERLSGTQRVRWALRMSRIFPYQRGILVRRHKLLRLFPSGVPQDTLSFPALSRDMWEMISTREAP